VSQHATECMRIRFLSGPDIDAPGLTAAEILGAVEEAVREHGAGRAVLEPRRRVACERTH
jgi:alanine dehydrogenase